MPPKIVQKYTLKHIKVFLRCNFSQNNINTWKSYKNNFCLQLCKDAAFIHEIKGIKKIEEGVVHHPVMICLEALLLKLCKTST
jgi:hypothetical protein